MEEKLKWQEWIQGELFPGPDLEDTKNELIDMATNQIVEALSNDKYLQLLLRDYQWDKQEILKQLQKNILDKTFANDPLDEERWKQWYPA